VRETGARYAKYHGEIYWKICGDADGKHERADTGNLRSPMLFSKSAGIEQMSSGIAAKRWLDCCDGALILTALGHKGH